MDTPRFPYFGWRDLLEAASSIDPARAGLVGGAVAAAALGIGLALTFNMAPPSDGAVTVAAQPTARLPRPRPDEPLTTGSIGPVAVPEIAVAAVSLEEAIRQSGVVDPDREPAPSLRDRAALVASSFAGCDVVSRAQVLEAEDGKEAVVRIACGNGARFYLDAAEIEALQTPAQIPAPQPARVAVSDAEALQTCVDKVRAGLARPSSLRPRTPAGDVERQRDSDAVVRFDFEASDGFGYPLSLQAVCVFDSVRIARLEVAPR